MKTKNKFINIAALVLSVVFMIISIALTNDHYEMVFNVQMRVFGRLCTPETVMIEAALVSAIVYVIVTFVAIVLLLSALTSLLYKIPIMEAARKQMSRSLAFYGLIPLLTASLGGEFFSECLPANDLNSLARILKIDAVLDVASKYDGYILYFAVCLAVSLLVMLSYGILPDMVNKCFNAVFMVLGVVYMYNLIYSTVAFFKAGIWFVLFVALCYVISGVMVWKSKRKNDSPVLSA